MSGFASSERRLAQVLDGLPAVKRLAKSAYQRVNYFVHGQRGFKYWLHEAVAMSSAWNWAQTSEGTHVETFFGYYDKSPWSVDQRFLLSHGRTADMTLDVIVYDRRSASWHVVAKTAAWNLQQASMSQWLPGDGDRFIFNDVVDRRLVSRIADVAGGEVRTLPLPVQVVHPSGKFALTLNYRRLAKLRPEYGYVQPVVNFEPDQSSERDGVWRMDLEHGESDLLVTLDWLMRHKPRREMAQAKHKVNHILYCPSGESFVFMHRWMGRGGRFSRLYVHDGKGDARLLLDDRMVSHYGWRDNRFLLAWARTTEQGDRYYLVDTVDGKVEIVGRDVLDLLGDGHPSYSPDGQWIVTDSYPNRARQRVLQLYHPASERHVTVARFFAPLKFDGQQRCDLHPRWSRDGRMISVDSAHEGRRGQYVLDVSGIVGK